MVIPAVCFLVDHKHWFGIIPIWSIVELHILERLNRFLAQSVQECRNRHPWYVIFSVSHRLKSHFGGDTVLKAEVAGIVAEDKSFLQIEAEGEIVRQIEVGGNGDCTSIDESIFGIKSCTVRKDRLAPVDSLISGKCRDTAVKVECLRIVADDV